MPRFVEGVPRTQSTLFPERIEDYIDEENPVRAIDAFVDTLDLEQLGFQGMHPRVTGRPAYHPAIVLKLYVYGYLNRIQSTRRLGNPGDSIPISTRSKEWLGKSARRYN